MAYIHVYTGNGKGKSTAAFGLAVRAHYAGMKVYIGQFVRDMAYHETQIAGDLDNILIEQLGRGCYLERDPDPKDVDAAEAGLERCAKFLASGEYQMVILDELPIALYFKLITKEQILQALRGRHPDTEVVITGRYAPDWLIEEADLVTDMQEVKHYYTEQGVEARDGIER